MPLNYAQATVFNSATADQQIEELRDSHPRVDDQVNAMIERISQAPGMGLQLDNGYFVIQMPSPQYSGMCTIDIVYRYEPDGENIEIHAVRGF